MSYLFYIFQKQILKVKRIFLTMGPKKLSDKLKRSRKLLTIEQKKEIMLAYERGVRARNEYMRFIERLAARTGFRGNFTKCSIIGGDLNLPYADWNENAGGNSGTQAPIDSLVWENGYSQVIDSPTRGDALLGVYLVRPESSVTSSGIVQGVSDRLAVILEVDWDDTCTEPQVERVVPVYNKTDVSGLQTFLHDK